MTKRRQQLLELVKKEAKFLRTMLTSTEKDRLNFNRFYACNTEQCIYGLATGNCNSERAMELILDGCERVYSRDNDRELQYQLINGKPYYISGQKNEDNSFITPRIAKFYSPIEVFIAEENESNNKNLLNYIKGEKKTLVLK